MKANKTYKNIKNVTDKEITMKLLDSLDNKDNTTQKSAAQSLGIAVGLVNTYIKRCIKKGWLKVKNIPAHRYAYYLTPKGFAKKSQLVSEYLSDSLQLFREAKSEYQNIFEKCKNKKYKRIAFIGDSDLTEVALLVKENNDIVIAGIVTESQKTNFPSLNSYTFDDLPINVDAYVLTEINQFQEYYKKIKKVVTTQEILIPKFLKLSKGKRNE
jgi:DNA-binding MarR family transcriptional regulator